MRHAEAEASDFASRYVTHRLSDEEAQRFEEHFVDCPRCLDAIESAQGLASGLRQVGVERPSARGAWSSHWTWVWAAAAAVVVATVGAVLIARTVRERDYWRSAAASQEQAAREAHQMVDSLQSRLSRATDVPAVGPSVPVLALTLTRGPEPSIAHIALPPGTPFLVLAVDLAAGECSDQYAASVAAANGATVWSARGLQRSSPTDLGVVVPAPALSAGGNFALSLHCVTRAGQDATIGTYRFRVTPR